MAIILASQEMHPLMAMFQGSISSVTFMVPISSARLSRNGRIRRWRYQGRVIATSISHGSRRTCSTERRNS